MASHCRRGPVLACAAALASACMALAGLAARLPHSGGAGAAPSSGSAAAFVALRGGAAPPATLAAAATAALAAPELLRASRAETVAAAAPATLPFAAVGIALVAATGAAVRGARRRFGGRTARKALTEIGQVKLNLPAGKATPAPPVGPALGEFGANIAFFVKEYNALTADKVGQVCPVIVHIMSDRSFTLEMKTPPTADLIHKAAGKDRGSGKAGIEIIGTISVDQLREIAEIKLPDLNIADVTRAMKIVHGTCVASGVKVEGYEEWLASVFPAPASILERYGPGKENLPPPWNEE